jgi:hypothetical protein
VAILFAYIMVVLIWATTPLTISWSGDSISFMAGVTLRMSLALALGMLVKLLLSRPSLFLCWQLESLCRCLYRYFS